MNAKNKKYIIAGCMVFIVIILMIIDKLMM